MGCKGKHTSHHYTVRGHNSVLVGLLIMCFVDCGNHKPSQITSAAISVSKCVYVFVWVCLPGLGTSTEADPCWKCNSHEAGGALMLLPHTHRHKWTHTSTAVLPAAHGLCVYLLFSPCFPLPRFLSAVVVYKEDWCSSKGERLIVSSGCLCASSINC